MTRQAGSSGAKPVRRLLRNIGAMLWSWLLTDGVAARKDYSTSSYSRAKRREKFFPMF